MQGSERRIPVTVCRDSRLLVAIVGRKRSLWEMKWTQEVKSKRKMDRQSDGYIMR